MTARTFLINGLLAGLLAGFAAFLVAHYVGEPPVDAAIALEEAGAAQHEDTHHEDDAVVSRQNQSTWGLLTGTLAIGTALGGLTALGAAAAAGRFGGARVGQTTALVALIGFVSVSLVPFLKYPATPPAVGSGDTIGDRTTAYFVFLAISVLAAVISTVVATRLLSRWGTYRTVLVTAGGYLAVMILAAALMPTVDEVGRFPATLLWEFRRASALTLATLWGVLGIALVGLVGRSYARAAAEADAVRARRELAASL